jgi:hypothetical protein
MAHLTGVAVGGAVHSTSVLAKISISQRQSGHELSRHCVRFEWRTRTACLNAAWPGMAPLRPAWEPE